MIRPTLDDVPEDKRLVLFGSKDRTHLMDPPASPGGYLGFTLCGKPVPHHSLIGEEIPKRWDKPFLCRVCLTKLSQTNRDRIGDTHVPRIVHEEGDTGSFASFVDAHLRCIGE